MSNWQTTCLGELLSRSIETAEILPGESYKEITVKLWGKGVVLRGIASGAAFNGSRRFLARKGQLILSRIDARNGAIGIVPETLDESVVSNDFPLFRLDPNRVLPQYFEWLSKTKPFVELCQNASEGTTNRVRLQENRFLNLQIPLPSLPEQRRIVARIEELAAKINEARERRRYINDTELPSLRSGMVTRAFQDKWTSARLEDLCSLITDGTHQTPRYADDGYMFLSAQNVKPFKFMPDVHRKVSVEDYRACIARAKPQKGDVLMTRVGAMIGEAAVIDRDLDFAFYVSLAILRPIRDKVLPEFLVHWLNSPSGLLESRKQTLGKGHSQGNLNLKLLRGFQIPLPSLAEQRRIIATLANVHSQVDGIKRLQAEIAAKLDSLLPSILDKAFTGEL